jgi:DNA processing protein
MLDLGASAPEQLFHHGSGELRLLALRSVAIVGSRDATAYGMSVADRLAGELAEAGWVVVSGCAFGIDAAAHRGSLNAGGCTVGVVAGGIQRALRSPQATVAHIIARGGMIVSESGDHQAPRRHTFLLRNRLIAALTRATVVVEAAARSGALNTARTAEILGRVVIAMPGPVSSPVSVGTHTLIRDGRAVLARDTSDVLELVEAMGQPEPAQAELMRWHPR